MGSQFRQRVIMSLLSITLLIFFISYAHYPLFKPFFILINATIICMALVEFYELAKIKGYPPLVPLSLVSAVSYLLVSYLVIDYPHLSSLPFFMLLFCFVAFFLFFFRKPENSITHLSITTFGLIYLAIPLTCITQIVYFESPHSIDHGRLWLTYVLVLTKITDMGAYFIGKTLGRNKLALQISPKKTVEGGIGGMFFCVTTSIFFYFYFFSTYQLLTLWQAILLGFSINILAQIGDLSESVLKRDAGVKDSSHLPGFGGILDVVDSLVFTLPFIYLLLKMQVIG